MSPVPTIPATWQGLLAEFRRCFSSLHLPGVRDVGHGFGGLYPASYRHRDAGRRRDEHLLAARTRAPFLLPRGVVHRPCRPGAGRLILATLIEPGTPIIVAIDDSVTRRSGRKVHGAFWQYDGSATGTKKTSRGTCFVTLGIVVALPFLPRAVCLPVLARLYVVEAGLGFGAVPRGAAAVLGDYVGDGVTVAGVPDDDQTGW
ncbi:hypothetical protein [Nonomuraea sp. NPDC048916]|uniref:hypothetical protein n=1 Tax=Nonomuraea sp. NPDC048916 TaxID=3154232 RepID=UPI0033E0C770